MQQAKFQVTGMTCQHCVNSIEKALKDIGASGRVDLQGGTVTIDFDENKLSLNAVKEAIEEQGYDVA
jgi:copper chaperone